MTESDFFEMPTEKDNRLNHIGSWAGVLNADRPQYRGQTGYSVFLRWMKILLPLGAFAIIAVLLSWNVMNTGRFAMESPSEKAAKDQTLAKNELLSPHFNSVDEKNQPYTITATRALQGETDQDMIFLEGPMADITLETGRWMALKAQEGAFSQAKQHLSLKKDVILYHDEGYAVKTPALEINLKDGTASTTENIKGQGPMGTLWASGGMAYDSKNGRLVLKGPARLVLFNTKHKPYLKGF